MMCMIGTCLPSALQGLRDIYNDIFHIGCLYDTSRLLRWDLYLVADVGGTSHQKQTMPKVP